MDSNSNDVHPGRWLEVYEGEIPDTKNHIIIRSITISGGGFIWNSNAKVKLLTN